MSGSIWGSSSQSNKNGNNSQRSNKLFSFRRRRSLLGRKIHSENDLPQRDAAMQQQQQLYTDPHALPENVKTILMAGTPECWNMTTTKPTERQPQQYPLPSPTLSCTASHSNTNSQCDLSELTATIDEDEPYEGGLEWLLLPGNKKNTGFNNRGNRRSTKKQTSQQQKHQEPSSMVVVYQFPSSAQTPPDPQQTLHLWLNSLERLLQSEEMSSFLGSTQQVIQLAGGLAIRTALMPVTLPFHVALATRDFCCWTAHQTIAQTTGAVRQLTNDRSDNGEQQQGKKDNAPDRHVQIHGKANALDGLLHLLQVAGKVKDEIGAAVVSIITPPNPQNSAKKKSTIADDEERLRRLELPVFPENSLKKPQSRAVPTSRPTVKTVPTLSASSSVTPADYSKYLLRVEDLNVTDSNQQRLLFFDLSSDYRDPVLLRKCLDELAIQGLALTTTHAPNIPPETESAIHPIIEWKTEGTTAKLLRKKAIQSPERWQEILRSDIFMWSGSFSKTSCVSSTYRQHPLFLARGVIANRSPRDFMEMLWDNKRTCEYNVYCLGREDVFCIDDQVLTTKKALSGTKVVRSETRVPFTALSVTLCTMMHCRPLPGGPKDGYMIVSRSLLSGMAGSHISDSIFCNEKSVDKCKSEILWGVNVFRAVAGQPEQTELTSMSQVASALVPHFLSQKIGVMGVEDFFRNVRNTNPKMSSASSDDPCRLSIEA